MRRKIIELSYYYTNLNFQGITLYAIKQIIPINGIQLHTMYYFSYTPLTLQFTTRSVLQFFAK